MSDPELSLVIPAFNSVAYLAANVDRIRAFYDRAGIDGEVVVADDGSTDGTSDSIVPSDRVKVLRLPHRGKGASVRAAMAATTGALCGFTDADLPYGTESLPLAISYIRDRRYHAVIGDRTLPGSTYANTGPLRTAVSEIASFLFRTLVTGGIYDTQCGFKLFRGDVGREVFRLSRTNGFAIDVEVIYLLLKYRLDVKRIPVRLERNAPSSVRVVRDSLSAFGDIAAIRGNWAMGRYRTPLLHDLLQAELLFDAAEAARAGGEALSGAQPVSTTMSSKSTVSPRVPPGSR
jgi:dolichyl-phosphate beta-glucosyltransferase